MTIRPIIASILLLQLSIGPQAFAVDPVDAPATQLAPAPSEKRVCPKLAACLEKNYLTFIFSKAGDCDTVQRINEKYKTEKCNLDKKFRGELVDLWDSRKTEAGYDCIPCLEKARKSLIANAIADSQKIREKTEEAVREKTADPDEQVIREKTEPRDEPRERYVERQERPARVHREADPVPAPAESSGFGGSFMNSNAMWGLGGLAVGGILGYMLGKNSAQQQQYYNPYPIMPQQPFGGPAFGQVPQRPGLPPFYRAPMGGYGGGGGYGPGGYGGYPGGNYGAGNYGAGNYGAGNYGLGVNYGSGFNTGFANTIYNGGRAPVMLPAPGTY